MTLNLKTLELLVEKDRWREVRFVFGSTLATLEGEHGRSHILVYLSKEPTRLSSSGSIGGGLQPQGANFVGSSQYLYALNSPTQELLRWNREELALSQILPLEAPAAGLSLDPQDRWLSWTSLEAPERYELRLAFAGQQRPFWKLAAVPFGFAWHPQRPLCLALLVPPQATPWQGARLFLGHYKESRNGPQLLRDELLAPPPPASANCLEAAFNPQGQTLIGLWRTGEWYQLWSYHLDLRRWTQLSFAAVERALPRRRSDRHSFVMAAPTAGAPATLLSLRQERGFFQLEQCPLPLTAAAAPPTPPLFKTVAGLSEFTDLQQLEISASGQNISLIAASAQIPPTQIELSWNSAQDSWPILQRRPHAPLPASRLQAESLSWASSDGHIVQGLLYRDRRRAGPQPLLLPVHGGPTAQVSASWPVKARAFVEAGYAVLYVNYRGSWGYGYSYHQALAGRWGELDILDIISVLKPLAAAGWIDPKRVGIWGGDIGGSTVLRLIQRYPKLIKAAIAVYPICDFHDYRQKCGLLNKAELHWALGGTSLERLEQRSPLYARDKIITPLALFHGGLDPLIPQAHIESLAMSLQSRQIPCWLTIYPTEAHSWQARSTLEDYYCKVGSFLARFLRKEV